MPDASHNMDPAILAQRLSVIHDDVADIKTALRDLTMAITRLAVIEERQTQVSNSMERAFKSIETLAIRVSAIEQRMPMNDRASLWVDRVTWGVLGLFSMYVAKSLGLLS